MPAPEKYLAPRESFCYRWNPKFHLGQRCMELGLRSSRLGQTPLYGLGLVVLLLITLGITVPYVSSQHAFLGGDINDGFYRQTIEVSQLFRSSPWQAIQTVFQAANTTYNKFYTLPLIPFVLAFGDSYLVYIVSVAIVYLLPLNLMMGVLAVKLIPGQPKVVFTSAVFLSLLIAPDWIAVLIGHPDIGATLLVVLAIWVCLFPVETRWGWLLPYRWQVPALGVLMATAILFRRHFAYANLALVGAILGQTAIVFTLELRHHPRQAVRNLLEFGIRLGLVLATSLATLAIVAPEFTREALTTDFVSLYDSWSRTVAETFGFYTALYGWGIWVLTLSGWGLGIATGMLALPVASFVCFYGSISIALWLFKLRYTETYYAIHFVPLILLGMVALVWVLWRQLDRPKRTLALGIIGFYSIANLLIGITPLGGFQNSLRPLFGLNYPPPVRQNYEAIVQVTQFLRQLAPAKEPIFVVHSGPLPEHLILAAERTLYGDEGSILNLRGGSYIDSVGFYSIRELLEAQYVVLTQPFTPWNNGQQDTAKVVIDAFNEGWEITQDFEPLPTRFDLQDGAVTQIYRRIRPTPIDRAVRTLTQMRTEVNKPLGKQLDWVVVSQPFNSTVKPGEEGSYTLRLKPFLEGANPAQPRTLLYMGNLADQVEIRGRVRFRPARCSALTLTFSALNSQGQRLHQTSPLTLTQPSPLQVALPATDAAYLLLDVTQSGRLSALNPSCTARLTDLTVSPQVK